MIDYMTPDDYFSVWHDHPDITDKVEEHVATLLRKVNELLDLAFMEGIDFAINPATNSYVSGQTLGGFRPLDTKLGAKNSAHKCGQAVDIYDPAGEFGAWCLKHPQNLQMLGLCAEHPSVTPTWTHLSTRAVGGKTFFFP